ncbi:MULTISPECIES: prepilin-type N-terminal cleavage/methylation domain-containing protein [unclassified Fibrobacter]|uniref:prepilin-type N-terminal cleavage/methylation domain-containing protein n=2 Tax=Fibrobacter TaxID=832 RepID=UPI0025B84304|nr:MULTISPECIES: prepilin-type N-terminal cleavage/methylation domain-containing protein [unclassified Fibrobacter]
MHRGFTLMELMVALALAGVLVSLSLGAYGKGLRDYAYALSSHSLMFDAKVREMQKSIRELRGCPDANRL